VLVRGRACVAQSDKSIPPQCLTVNCRFVQSGAILQAIFERDRTKIPDRIREAARALMVREHELCTTTQKDWAERELVITALHYLEAFRDCLEIPRQERVQGAPFSPTAVKPSITSISWE